MDILLLQYKRKVFFGHFQIEIKGNKKNKTTYWERKGDLGESQIYGLQNIFIHKSLHSKGGEIRGRGWWVKKLIGG